MSDLTGADPQRPRVEIGELARIQTWSLAVETESAEFVFHVPGSLATRSDPDGELKVCPYVALRQLIQDSLAISKVLELIVSEFRNDEVIADVHVELIARSTPTRVRGQTAMDAFGPRVFTVVAPTHPYIEE